MLDIAAIKILDINTVKMVTIYHTACHTALFLIIKLKTITFKLNYVDREATSYKQSLVVNGSDSYGIGNTDRLFSHPLTPLYHPHHATKICPSHSTEL